MTTDNFKLKTVVRFYKNIFLNSLMLGAFVISQSLMIVDLTLLDYQYSCQWHVRHLMVGERERERERERELKKRNKVYKKCCLLWLKWFKVTKSSSRN